MLTGRFLAVSIAATILVGCSGATRVSPSGGTSLLPASKVPPLSAESIRSERAHPFAVGLGSSTSVEAVLHDFTDSPDGAYAFGALIADKDGTLYGTTSGGGIRKDGSDYGTVFKLTHSGTDYTVRILYRFQGGDDGAGPFARLIADDTGAIYGTTESGGKTDKGFVKGTVFKLTPSGSRSSESVLHRFLGFPDGAFPMAGVIEDKKGALYGTTSYGGAYRNGIVFKLTPTGGVYKETVIHTFLGSASDGAYPYAGLLADKTGAIYGTTAGGGASGTGTVFKVMPSGSGFTLLYSFQGGSDGGVPMSDPIVDSSGVLYGTAGGGDYSCFDCGVVFRLTPSRKGYVESVLHVFEGGNDGAVPGSGLVADAKGVLYGTTEFGGGTNCHGGAVRVGFDWRPGLGYDGCGTVFKLTPSGSRYTYKIVYHFQGPPDGQYPFDIGSLVTDKSGAVYGTTFVGGTGSCSRPSRPGCGTVFKITP